MIDNGVKYFAVIFLLLLFIFKGVAPVLPVLSDSFKTIQQKELQENRENGKSENTEGNSSEKEPEKKELFGLSFFDITSSLKYATLTKTYISRQCRFQPDVFLSIATPPPKHTC